MDSIVPTGFGGDAPPMTEFVTLEVRHRWGSQRDKVVAAVATTPHQGLLLGVTDITRLQMVIDNPQQRAYVGLYAPLRRPKPQSRYTIAPKLLEAMEHQLQVMEEDGDIVQ